MNERLNLRMNLGRASFPQAPAMPSVTASPKPDNGTAGVLV